MRLVKSIVFLLTIILIVGCGAPEDKPMQWKKLPLPTSENITGIHFPDDELGYLVTDAGSVLKTGDGGATFAVLSFAADCRLEDAYFRDEDQGFVFGENGLMAKTSDGGGNWTRLPYDETYHFIDMGFLDDEHGFLTGVIESSELSSVGFIGSSSDMGETWSFDTTEYRGLSHLHILEGNHVFISGVGFIIYTTDRGVSWQHTYTGNPADTLEGVCFPDVRYGWCVGRNGLLLQSEDGGWSWKRHSEVTVRDLICVTAPEISDIYVAGDAVIAFSSSNGRAWQIDSLNYSATFFDIHLTGDEIYLCGSQGTLLRLVD